jgi:hypothetical protein
MQKRRVRSSNSDMQLPVTMSDVSNKKASSSWSSSSKPRNRNLHSGSTASTLIACGLLVVFILFLVFLLTADFDFVSHHPAKATVMDPASGTTGDSLSAFKSLDRALAGANLVGLYFAASWCSMSTPVSTNLEIIFSGTGADSIQDRVLSNDNADMTTEKKDFALVYVSSDNSEEEMKDYVRWNWINVPFASPDKNNIKRHFRTCAQVEMEELQIDVRRFHIPTLIIIDSVTQGILSTNGVDELEEYGKGVLDHWLQIQMLTRALEDKYEES